MISSYSSVLFVYTSFIFCCSIAVSTKFKFLVIHNHNIIRCSDYEYLIACHSTALNSSNLSCPNRTELFENQSPSIYNLISVYRDCNATTKAFSFAFYAMIPSSKLHENSDITDEHIQLLTSTVEIDNSTYSSEATRGKNSSVALLAKISLPWKTDNLYIFQIIFNKQPMACRFKLNSSKLVENGMCTGKGIDSDVLCYYEPFSEPPLQNIAWNELIDLLYTSDYLPKNWENKGKIYYDIRSPKNITTTTITTATTTTITIATIITTTITTTTITTVKTTSTKSKSTVPTKSKLITTKFQKPKPATAAAKSVVPKKRSSSSSLLLVVFLIFLLCGIIGGVLFFIYHSRRNRQDNDQAMLNRVGSEESNQSEMSAEFEPEQPEVNTTRKGGRTVNHLDPDAE